MPDLTICFLMDALVILTQFVLGLILNIQSVLRLLMPLCYIAVSHLKKKTKLALLSEMASSVLNRPGGFKLFLY